MVNIHFPTFIQLLTDCLKLYHRLERGNFATSETIYIRNMFGWVGVLFAFFCCCFFNFPVLVIMNYPVHEARPGLIPLEGRGKLSTDHSKSQNFSWNRSYFIYSRRLCDCKIGIRTSNVLWEWSCNLYESPSAF